LLRLGYHPATYVQHDVEVAEALQDIAETGWLGFEWSPSRLEDAYADSIAYRDYLDGLGLQISGLYCPCSFSSEEQIGTWNDTVDRSIEFALAVRTDYIMFDGGSRELERNSTTIDSIAAHVNEVGQRIVDAGLTCTWHQHWGTLFEYAGEFEALMAATDPEIIKFTPDTAQLALGDFDIPATFEKHLHRIQYIHFKDLDDDRRFIELGRGKVDFAPLAEMLLSGGVADWIVTDLDYTSLDPRESSRHNLAYLRELFGQ